MLCVYAEGNRQLRDCEEKKNEKNLYAVYAFSHSAFERKWAKQMQ